MANGHGQVDDQSSGMGFVTGLFTGAVIGAGIGLLFAPRPGADLRQDIANSAAEAGKAMSEKYRQTSHVVVETIDDLADRGRQAAERGRQAYDEAREVVSEARDTFGRAADEAMKGAEKVASAAGDYKQAATDGGSRF